MPKCTRLRAKADAFAYLFGMLSRPSIDRSPVCRTSVFEKYYASWKEYTWGTLISGGNFWKFWKFPDTNILWKFSEVPKILTPGYWSRNFRKFRLFLSSIFACAKFLSMSIIIFSWVLMKCQFCYEDWLVCFVHLWYILLICSCC